MRGSNWKIINFILNEIAYTILSEKFIGSYMSTKSYENQFKSMKFTIFVFISMNPLFTDAKSHQDANAKWTYAICCNITMDCHRWTPLLYILINYFCVIFRGKAQVDCIQERYIYDDENFFALVEAASEILGILRFFNMSSSRFRVNVLGNRQTLHYN